MSKPNHLNKEYAAQFADQSVVENYKYRPCYSNQVINLLAGLVSSHDANILDVGCGTGEVSIPLAELGYDVDGIDPSMPMILAAKAKGSTVNFINSDIESYQTDKHYDLVLAANSIHWADWDQAFPKIATLLNGRGVCAIVTGGELTEYLGEKEIFNLIMEYSTNREFKPYSVVDLLVTGGFFKPEREYLTEKIVLAQPVFEFIASFHARNGFSVERMGQRRADEFDQAVWSILHGYDIDEQITGSLQYKIVTGRIVD